MNDPRYTFDDLAESQPLRVSQGVFVLRYVASPDGLDAPVIGVSVPAGADVEVIDGSDPFSRRADVVLGMPGDSIVLRARRDSAVLVSVRSSGRSNRRQAHIALERISCSVRPSFAPYSRAGHSADPSETLEILAHVSRRGDMTIKAGDWICGPQFPMAIEGLELRWHGPASGVDIVTTVCINARGRTQLPAAASGQFVGSRGKAAPIVSLSFALSGPMAAHFKLTCEALFLGAAIIARSGASIELSGPTGHEPLVGLRLSVVPVQQAAAALVAPQPYEIPLHAPVRASAAVTAENEQQVSGKMDVAGSAGRVRIFRTSRPRPALN